MRQRSPLRIDRDLDHTLSPLAKELVCLGDFVQIKRVREKGCVTTLFRGQRANAQADGVDKSHIPIFITRPSPLPNYGTKPVTSR
jgi:hypothetical protein